ncbi:Zinc finger CCHC-type protein, partial [Dioscorea alata]
MWFTTVRIVLLGMDLLGHVDGSSPQSSTPDASWTLADRRTMTLTCQSCEIDVRMEIGHLSTAQAMWEHLGNMFEHSSSARQYAILQDLTHIQQHFEAVHSQLLNRDPLPSFDDVIRSVIAEETRLSTLSPRLVPTDTVLVVTSPRSTRSSTGSTISPASASSSSSRTSVICHYCKRPGHMKSQCLKLQQRQQQQSS